jgi:predicted nuclease of predicted toxin-antitoxin system
VAGRFPLYIDADIRGPLVKALTQGGWDVLRAIDAYPERTRDSIHFERAASEGRVLVSHDIDQLKLALRWVDEGRPFRGFLTWPQLHHRRFTDTAFVAAFEKLAAEEDAFPAVYPIRYLDVA